MEWSEQRTYIRDRDGVSDGLVTKILHHMLDKDRALNNLALYDSSVSGV